MPFWSENGYRFAHFGLESGMAFQGLRKCMKVFIVLIPNEYPGKREREICEVEMDFKELFCLLF